MTAYQIEQQLKGKMEGVVIVPFSTQVCFLEGLFVNCDFKPDNIYSMWCLICACVNNESYTSFEINLGEDVESKILGVIIRGKYCLFQENDDNTIDLLGVEKIDEASPELIKIIDPRWETFCYLPKGAFIDVNEAIEFGSLFISGKQVPKLNFPRTMIPEKLLASPSSVIWDDVKGKGE